MKKIIMAILSLIISLVLLSSCSMVPMTKLDSMFRTDQETRIGSGIETENEGDTVTISKTEYEKYKLFSEMFAIYDAANDSFYQEPDQQKLAEYAARGLMAGLDDPYSFYYNPEEYAEMWEDDEGNYVGIGVMIQANMETQLCTIVRVFKNGPAEEAGVQRGDILYKVGDDLYVNANNLQEAVDIMKQLTSAVAEAHLCKRS